MTPFLQPRIVSDDKTGILLQWHRIYFPPYDREPALQGYTVEVLEPPSKEWKTLVKGLPTKNYLITNLKPTQDYIFRVRGESETGELTEPSPSVPLFRSKVPDYQIEFPWSPDDFKWTKQERRRLDLKESEIPESTTSEVSYRKRKRMLASEENLDSLFENQPSLSASSLHLEEDDTVINRPYLEMLTCKVPPRMPLEPPELIDDGSDVAWLIWKQAAVPHTTKMAMTKSITYSIEMRMPPCYDWNSLVENLVTTKYKLTDLMPDRNYVFRVRCFNEFGGGEATLPVTLRRATNGLLDDYNYPQELDSEDEVIDWENFDGERVPPRLPLDKPDITSIASDSLVLTWAHARNPAYGKQSPITYSVEVKEQWARAWRTLGSNLTETRFHVKDLQPNQSYSFRILAENEFGLSEPSMTATLHRAIQTPAPTGQENAKVDKLLLPSATFVDPLSIQTPPRVPVGRPKISEEKGTSLVLSWKAARTPSYAKRSFVTYIIEVREPPAPNWVPIASEIEDTKYEVKELKEEQDYMFRIRACNEAGQSEASLPATLYREIDYIKQLQHQLSTESSTLLSPDILSPDEPKSFFWDSEAKTPCAPEFISDEIMQYGVEFSTMRLELKIRAFPPPKVFWYFKDEKIEYGDRYTAYIKPGGIVTLEFPDLSWNDTGDYKCYIENEIAFSSKIVTLNLAEPPTIIKPMEDLFMDFCDHGTLQCQVDGIPYPTVTWLKNRFPITESSRVHAYHELPGRWFLVFEEANLSDVGSYECIVENAGGKISCTAQVEVSEFKPVPSYLLFREARLENFYYVLEEIGRGRHAIIRRLVEKSTGKEFAGKFMVLSDQKEKEFFYSELECLRVLDHKYALKVYDAYETDQSLVLVTELIYGGELIEKILTSYSWTESEAAFYIKQLLLTLDALKLKGVTHLDIKPANIMYVQETDSIKLIDFGFAKKIHNFPLKLNYGTPEFSSPEVVCSEIITASTDIWNVGVLTYILLSGISPFYGGSVQETLNLIEKGIWKFDEEAFRKISSEGKDFIGNLLKRDPLDRLEIDECLSHPWLEFASKKGQGARLDLKNFEAYHKRDLAMRKKNAVLRCARLESLTKMELAVPTTPSLQPQIDPETGKLTFPDSREYGEFLDSEARFDWNKRFERRSESEFSLRSREFLKLAHKDNENVSAEGEAEGDISMFEDEENMKRTGRDRRRLSELDVDHDKLAKIEKEDEWISASSDERLERQLNREKEGQVYVMERKPSVGMPKEGYRPIFRAKLTDQVVRIGDNVTFMCLIRGRPTVTVAWYKNEEFLTKSNRIRMSLSEDGVSSMTLISAKPYDVGVYKCVARNKMGRTVCRAKLILGDNPGQPESPIITAISAHEALLVWDPPSQDGDCPILFYRVYCKKADDYQWRKSLKTINECAYIGNLEADTSYLFRVSCQNKFGLSPYSFASAVVTTKPENFEPLSLYKHPDYAIMLCRNAETISSLNRTKGPTNIVEYYRDRDDEIMNFDPAEQYEFLEEITRGAFYKWNMCRSKRTKELYLSRHTPYETENEDLMKEFNLLVTVQHVNVITVIGAFLHNNIHTVIFEYMDSENILDHLSSRTRYTEDEVARIVTQLLDALQYLHFLCIIHLNLQPDNILMGRICPILKLKDFSLSQKIVTPIGKHVPRDGHPEFMAPEVVVGEPAGVAADVWGVGIIATLLLSGETPYIGSTREETLGNIAYNRFDGTIMYENVSKEALKFISKIVKRIPTNRMTVDDCLEHNWLQQSDEIVKIRKENIFMSFKLRNYATQYENEKGVVTQFNPVASVMVEQPERKFKMPDISEVIIHNNYSNKEKSSSQKSVSFDSSYLEFKLASSYRRVAEELAQKSLSSAAQKDSFPTMGTESKTGSQEVKEFLKDSSSLKKSQSVASSNEQVESVSLSQKTEIVTQESKQSVESASISKSQTQEMTTVESKTAVAQQQKQETKASSETKSQSQSSMSSANAVAVTNQAVETTQKSTSASKTQVQSLQEIQEASVSKAMSSTEEKSASMSQETKAVSQEKAKATSGNKEVMVQEQKTISVVQQSDSTMIEKSSEIIKTKGSISSEKISAEAITGTASATEKRQQSVQSATSSVQERKQSLKSTESTTSTTSQGSQQTAIESGSGDAVVSKDLTAGATCAEFTSHSSETVQHEEVIEEVVTTTTKTSDVVTSVETSEVVETTIESSPSIVQD